MDTTGATRTIGDSRVRRALAVVVAAAAMVGCGSSSPPAAGTGGVVGGGGTSGPGGSVGRGGVVGTGGDAGGGAGAGGTANTAGATGTAGSGGTTGAAGAAGNAGAAGGGGTGSQPIGAPCVNSGMCSQADGPAVCCLQILTCVLDSQCPASGSFVSCATQPCARSGWVCCDQGGMQFCTKQSACGP